MRDRPFFSIRSLTILVSCVLCLALTACGSLPQVRAEQRLFLDLSLEFLGEYQLPKTTFQDTPVGGLSALAYDRKLSRFYALSDDRSNQAPARFYTLKSAIAADETGKPHLDNIAIEDVTFLKDAQGNTYPPGSIDPEGLALSPRGTLYLATEGIPSQEINPFIGEFDLERGQLIDDIRLPQRYFPPDPNAEEELPRGVQENLGFEALTLGVTSLAPQDPFRLFTAPESSLVQDTEELTPEQGPRLRFLHYLINPIGRPVLVSENLYLLDPAPTGTLSNGLVELVALRQEGFLLSLERTYGAMGAGAKIFQVAGADATDTTQINTFKAPSRPIKPLRKQLLLDLNDLEISLDNLEGMTLGPRLPDGSQLLVLVSDDNFREEQVTQFLLFRLLYD